MGDRRVVDVATWPAQHDAPTEMSGITTEHGVGVDDSIDEIPDRFNIARVDRDPATDARFVDSDEVVNVVVISANQRKTRSNLEPGILRGAYLTIDGSVVGFGSEELTC